MLICFEMCDSIKVLTKTQTLLKKKKYDTNELTYKTNRLTDRKQTYGYQRGKAWGERN